MISEEVQKKLKPTLEQIIKTSDLDSLTLKLLRRKLEKEFNLEEKALDSHPYKDHIKEWTDEIIDKIQSNGNDKEEEKEKTSEKKEPVKAKPVKKAKAEKEEDEDFEDVKAPKKKNLSLKRKRNVVDDEDDEDEFKDEDENDNENDDDYKDDDDDYTEEPKPVKKKRAIAKKEEKKTEEVVTDDEKVEDIKESESEPEDLIEDIEENKPVSKSRKRSTKSKSTTKKTKTRTRTTKSKGASINNIIKCGSEEIEVDEKDAATIEKLKKFVRECGCKKIWSKEFSGCTTANSVIKVLKNMLRELGIEGKPSLAKCKEIATRRELLKDCEELTTNVIYDRREKRSRNFYADHTKTVKNKIEDDDDDDEDDEELKDIDDDDAKDGDFMDLSKYGEPEDSDDE